MVPSGWVAAVLGRRHVLPEYTATARRGNTETGYNDGVASDTAGVIMAAADLVVAFTGASGALYGVRLLEVLLHAGRTVHLTLSPAGAEVIEQELGRKVQLGRFDLRDLLGDSPALDFADRVHYHDHRNFQAGIASGSFLTGGMAVCPCSMGTVGAIANGMSQNLIHRAADVHLKEKRKLILVPRETPLHLIQLRNLTACAEAGAVILPAMPAFYTRPRSLQDAVDFIVGRVCDQLGVEHSLSPRWGA
jgi:4-hydroxy-3-polyprenylbenzoate decarboxylase